MAVLPPIGRKGPVLFLPGRAPCLDLLLAQVPNEIEFVEGCDLLPAQLALPSSRTLPADPIAQPGVLLRQRGHTAVAILLLE